MLFKRQNARAEANEKPIIEGLLQDAYTSFEQLRTLRARVASSGIDLDVLPDDVALRAFALLGNHDRNAVAMKASPHLTLLMGKGLIENSFIDTLSTPMLRFFAHIDQFLDGLLDISQRIEAGIASWKVGERTVGSPVIRCADKVSGFYSPEIKSLAAYVSGAEWLLVRPDPIFGLAETLLRVNADGLVKIISGAENSRKIHCDDGMLLLAAMAASGSVTVHAIQVTTHSTLPEMIWANS